MNQVAIPFSYKKFVKRFSACPTFDEMTQFKVFDKIYVVFIA